MCSPANGAARSSPGAACALAAALSSRLPSVAMRYLILAAGMGKRMGSAGAAGPKCLIDIGGEPLIGRLLRQIRTHDPAAEIDVVLGYRAETVAPVLAGCRIVINPFFDITGINASLWFARASFDRALMVIHGDVVLSDDLAARLFAADAPIADRLRQLGPAIRRRSMSPLRTARSRASA